MVKEYLENKYWERFVLEQHWYGTGSGSPFPGVGGGTESGAPMYWYAYAEDDMDFRFRVYVYPESLEKSLNINNVKEIRNGYSWKFLREKTREYFDTRMAEMIPDERKWIISTLGNIRFGESINEDSPIEKYFLQYNKVNKVTLWITLIANGESESDVLQNALYAVTKEFYEEYDGEVALDIACFKVKIAEEFINMNEKEEENFEFSREGKFDTWREKLEYLFSIEDFYTMYRGNGG